MDLDLEEAPPELYDSAETDIVNDTSLTNQIKDLKMTKVPITIVTGTHSLAVYCFQGPELIRSCRLLGRRKDYTLELYPKGRTWKEDCSHFKRLVHTSVQASVTFQFANTSLN